MLTAGRDVEVAVSTPRAAEVGVEGAVAALGLIAVAEHGGGVAAGERGEG